MILRSGYAHIRVDRFFRNASAVAILLVSTIAAAQDVSIQVEDGAFKVSGWRAPASAPAKGWGSLFDVYAGDGSVPPMAGRYAVESGSLVFHPAYPLAPGVRYRAVFLSPAGRIEKIFDGPPRPTNRIARVEQVYPSGDVWPSNQLRVYIYFSQPMSRDEARHIHMLDSDGKELAGSHAVFLPGEELWDPAFRRLTMTLDPGRIKRGLTSNEAIGPPITEGRRYTLVIDADWPDARGVPMIEGFRKSIRGGPARRIPPDPRQWSVTPPKAGTKDALVVGFPVPMNYPLLQRMLRVDRAPGSVSVARHETEWRYTPEQPWKPGAYQLIVDSGLEDLAGNKIGQPFDIDVFSRVTEHIETKTVSVPFTVK